MKQLPNRLLSIDIFRAITMLLMIYVNDGGSMKNIPEWIDHVKGNVDGMGFADIIFPAFLFIVGLSMPFAIKSRMNRGDSFLSISGHILLRSAALIIMGFFHMNLENYTPDGAIVSKAVWGLLITISFFLIWLDYPDTMPKTRKYILIGSGIILLLAMAYIYPGGPGNLRPEWWGILGIIGWAYLVCGFIFLLIKGNLTGVIIAFFVLLGINILSHMHLMPFRIPIVADASPESLIMGGAAISGIYAELVGKGKDRSLWIIFTVLGILSLIAAFVVRPFAGGISKIHSTPAWGLIAIGTGILIFELLIYLVDIKGKQNWFKIIRPAGTSTLTCYLLPYIWGSCMRLLHLRYPDFIRSGGPGIIRSFIFAFVIIAIVGLMEKRRIRLKI
jgi:heparan-alpha-glucosaminide N-acetyltransferase